MVNHTLLNFWKEAYIAAIRASRLEPERIARNAVSDFINACDQTPINSDPLDLEIK